MTLEPLAYRLRPAALNDLEVLVGFRVRLFQELGELGSDSELAGFRTLTHESFDRGLRSGTCLAWIAEVLGPAPIASAVMHLFPKLPSPVNLALFEGYLLNIYTVPAWRRQGAASALVEAAVREARALGLHRIRLHTTPEGRRVYEQAGFRPRLNEMEDRKSVV